MLAVARGVAAIEALEDVGEVRGGDAVAGVRDRELDVLARCLRVDPDGPTGGRVPERVGEQVRQQLEDALAVHGDQDLQSGCDVNSRGPSHLRGTAAGTHQAHPFGCELRPHPLDGSAHEVAHRDLDDRALLEAALLGARHLGDIAGQPHQSLGVIAQHASGLGRPLGDAVLEPVQVSTDDGERRSHLVGEVGQQPASGVLGRLQPLGDVVERVGQPVELGPGRRTRSPRRVVTVRQPGGHRRQVAQRLGHSAGQLPGDDESRRQRDEQCGAERDGVGARVGLLRVHELGGVGLLTRLQQVLVEQLRPDDRRHERSGENARADDDALSQHEPRAQGPARARGTEVHRVTRAGFTTSPSDSRRLGPW